MRHMSYDYVTCSLLLCSTAKEIAKTCDITCVGVTTPSNNIDLHSLLTKIYAVILHNCYVNTN